MAHEKVYVVCENMCMEEGYTKEHIDAVFEQQATEITQLVANCVVKEDFKFLEGTISNVTAGTQGQTTIEFPYGFTRDNTMIISIGVVIGNDTDALIEFRQQNDSLKYDYDVYMDNDGIVITMKNNNISFMSDFKFKVLIMKEDS